MIKIWDQETGAEVRTLQGHTDKVSSVAFSRDGVRLASASRDQTVKLWDSNVLSEYEKMARFLVDQFSKENPNYDSLVEIIRTQENWTKAMRTAALEYVDHSP